MQRLLWPLGLVAAVGLGLAIPRTSGDGDEVSRLKAQIGRLELRASALQARLQASETARAEARSGPAVAMTAALPAIADKPPRDPAATDGATRSGPSRRRPPRGEPQDDLSSATRATPSVRVAPTTVEAALDRFYKLMDAMGDPSSPGRWRQMRDLANELRAMGDAGTKALMQVLANGSSDDRRAAAQLLGQLQASDALPLLQSILANDEDVLMRRAAAAALRRMDMPETIPAMQAILANLEEDRFVRLSAAYGLAQLGSPLGIAGLEQIFQEANADGRGRDMAFRALTLLNDQAALPFMRQMVTSSAELSYRLQAIRFVATLNDPQALIPLQIVMQSPTEQPSIRDAAALAYASISGR